jgi:hypothetical protein
MGGIGDSTARVTFPADASLRPLVTTAVRSYLGLYHLPRAASRFILQRLQDAILRLQRQSRKRSVRAALSLKGGAGKIRVALRVSGAGTDKLDLGPLAKGSPSDIQAEYQAGRGGGTLVFIWKAPRKN